VRSVGRVFDGVLTLLALRLLFEAARGAW
jgi:hypothetical protein